MYGRIANLRGRECGALEQLALALRHVHRGARALSEVGDTEQVVPVPVRHEDRGTARSHPREEQTQLRRVPARVDDDGLRRVRARAHDVAVRPERAQRQLFDEERHAPARQPPRCPGAPWRSWRFWYWRQKIVSRK